MRKLDTVIHKNESHRLKMQRDLGRNLSSRKFMDLMPRMPDLNRIYIVLNEYGVRFMNFTFSHHLTFDVSYDLFLLKRHSIL